MRKNDLTVWKVTLRVGADHVKRGTSRLVWIINNRLWKNRIPYVSIERVSWMDEYDSFAAVELLPDRTEELVTEIIVTITIPAAVVSCSEGTAAKKPTLGFSSRRFAAVSFTDRANFACSSRGTICTPGAVNDKIAVPETVLSICSKVASIDHFGVGKPDGSPPAASRARSNRLVLLHNTRREMSGEEQNGGGHRFFGRMLVTLSPLTLFNKCEANARGDIFEEESVA
ncbi:hypothetical protein BTUL_0270g00110 [Botrytis tulipae]|uniref:Uncharacterized protein n=1 Tax=Botrytis tulipae TaxID=87230 RepID=A0A4Z1EDS6_9HELO|nr:hypothetical protein BTUL_0270g00110 [Botrytis tulipae]